MPETFDREVFDYVIVGAGSAGCVLANRLSADPSIRVLLLEAGGRDTSPFIHMPAGFFHMLRSGRNTWHYQTEPQSHLDGRTLLDARGKVLGGSSSINGMCYSRGSPDIFDLWANEGNPGWAYADVLPYFRRSEGNAHGDERFHGRDGPLAVTQATVTNPGQLAWLEATRQAGFPYSDDHNGARPEGFGPGEHTIKGGRRISTAVAYLRPAGKRPNLVIRTGAAASRIILENGRARGVEYRQGQDIRVAYADREIILSAGTFQSPQLLMLSGIGDADHLRAHAITPEVDLKGVGQNLHDHIGTQVQIASPTPVSPFALARNPLRQAAAFLQYLLTSGGPLTGSGTEVVGYLKSQASGHDLLDLKFYFLPMLFQAEGGIEAAHGCTTLIILTRPESRGELRLRSANPNDPPRIDANYLAHPRDREALRRGIGIARGILGQAAFSRFRGDERVPGRDCASDEALDRFLRQTCNVNYEAVGTCRMGSDEGAVVDPQLRVRGVEGLRVVDGSVMPRITTGDPNATIVMIAEKAADMILGQG